jgi:hypothetical protein
MIVFELLRKRKDTKEWVSKGLYSSYNKAQNSFIHKNGMFKIIERKVKTYID